MVNIIRVMRNTQGVLARKEAPSDMDLSTGCHELVSCGCCKFRCRLTCLHAVLPIMHQALARKTVKRRICLFPATNSREADQRFQHQDSSIFKWKDMMKMRQTMPFPSWPDCQVTHQLFFSQRRSHVRQTRVQVNQSERVPLLRAFV